MAAALLTHERKLLAAGYTRIAGVDEAGRGPLAGPVVAAAVMFPAEWLRSGLPTQLTGLNDSKQLSPTKRETYYELLTHWPEISFAVAIVGPEQIDKLNILRATHLAMIKAVRALPIKPEYVLVDGRPVPGLGRAHRAIVSGDRKSCSIAAASIIAKVTRDRIMLEYDNRWPQYGFARHKGYGTAEHLAALMKFGPCPVHRTSFGPVRNIQGRLF